MNKRESNRLNCLTKAINPTVQQIKVSTEAKERCNPLLV